MEATAVTLPDDIVLEILVRLTDEASLFRCAATCKLWRCLVADLRRRWPDNSLCLVGFFANICQIPEEITWLPRGPAAAQTFVPGPRSVLGHGRRSLGSLIPIADSLFDRVMPLASHGGLLLVRFVPRQAPINCSSYSTFIHLALCNLFTGTCDVLPPLLYKSHPHNVNLAGFAILTGDNFCSNAGQQRLPSPRFKVLIIGIGDLQDELHHYDLYMASSDQPSWRRSRLDQLKQRLIQNNGVVRRGTAHWLCQDWSSNVLYSLGVNAETGQVSLAKLPVPVAEPFTFYPYAKPQLTVAADGALMLVRLHIEDLELEIWTRQEDGGSADSWLLTRVVKIERPGHKSMDRAECVCFMEKSGKLLLVDNNLNAYLVDVETGAVEEMTDRFASLDCSCRTAVPVDIDWPAFLLSRLKGQESVGSDLVTSVKGIPSIMFICLCIALVVVVGLVLAKCMFGNMA